MRTKKFVYSFLLAALVGFPFSSSYAKGKFVNGKHLSQNVYDCYTQAKCNDEGIGVLIVMKEAPAIPLIH